MAKWTPLSSRPGTGRSRGMVEPMQSTTASKSRLRSSTAEVAADVDAGAEHDALVAHLLHAALDDVLLELEVGDAQSQQAADVVVALEDGDRVAGAVDLLRRRHARRARSRRPRPSCRYATTGGWGCDPALFPTAVGDRLLDVLDGHRVLVDREGAGGLAGGGADAAGELREVVGRMQGGQRALPLAPVDEVVPVRDQVAEGTAAVAERHAAVHAAGALAARLVVRPLEVELVVVARRAPWMGAARWCLARSVLESGGLTQVLSPLVRHAPASAASLTALTLGQDALVISRHNLDEARQHLVPVVQDAGSVGAAGDFAVLFQQAAQVVPRPHRARRVSSSTMLRVAQARGTCPPRPRRRPRRRSCRPRSCVRWVRGRRRGRRSCTRSRGRRHLRRRPRRRCCAPRSARPRYRG